MYKYKHFHLICLKSSFRRPPRNGLASFSPEHTWWGLGEETAEISLAFLPILPLISDFCPFFQFLTMDMGGSTSTTDFVQAVIRHMYE